jgi:transcriptional regulator with XRE-family HTH domain
MAWKFAPCTDYEKSKKDFVKKWRLEMLAVANNLQTLMQTLDRGVKPEQLKTSNSTHQVKHMEANKPQSQAEFFDEMFESSDDKAALREFTEKRALVSKLASLRATAGLTQSELAKQSGCVQATISKLESGVDSEVTVANIEAYAKATGFEITILISQRGKSLAEEIKHHAICIREAFTQLFKLAHMDNLIAQGVAQLHAECCAGWKESGPRSARRSHSADRRRQRRR